MKLIKAFLISLIAIISTTSFAQNKQESISTTVNDVKFSLEKIKPVGNELRFYFTITSLKGERTIGFGNGLGGKIARIIDNNGNEFFINKMALGDKRLTPYLDRITLIENKTENILLIASKNEVSKISEITSFVLKTEKKLIFQLSNIQVPYNNDKYPWENRTVEFDDNLYMKIDRVENIVEQNQNKFRIYFSILNTSETIESYLMSGGSLIIKDINDKEYKSYYFVHEEKKDHYTRYCKFVKDEVFNGYFEFMNIENIDLKTITLKNPSNSNEIIWNMSDIESLNK